MDLFQHLASLQNAWSSFGLTSVAFGRTREMRPHNMADDFSNLTDIIPDTAEPQVRPRRYGDAMIRLRGIHPIPPKGLW